MNILDRLMIHRPVTSPRRAPVPGPTAGDAGPGGDDDTPLGCGWFDSSHELRCGLSVHEHAGAESLAAVLPLAAWIELHLSAGAGRRLQA